MQDTSFSIHTTLKSRAVSPETARLLRRIKKEILGAGYELSLAFVGNKHSQTLNKTHRKKDKPTNVLSFPLSKTEGELVIALHIAKREAKKYGVTLPSYITMLFIHGCLHLKGLDHGVTMDRQEKTFIERFIK